MTASPGSRVLVRGLRPATRLLRAVRAHAHVQEGDHSITSSASGTSVLDTPGYSHSDWKGPTFDWKNVRPLAFYLLARGPTGRRGGAGRILPKKNIWGLLSLYVSEDDQAEDLYLANYSSETEPHIRNGLAWPGTKEACEEFRRDMGYYELSKPYDCKSFRQYIDVSTSVVGCGPEGVSCTEFECRRGTPLRKLVALMRLCEREGYPVLATEGFDIVDGEVVLKEGRQSRIKSILCQESWEEAVARNAQ